MTSCLCCHTDIHPETAYHPKCLEQLFGVSWAPHIPFSISDLPAKVSETIGKMSISGVQIKTSIKLDRASKEIEVAQEQGTHILKPEPAEFPEMPQNENICMALAKELEMDVPPHGLFPMVDGKFAYVIKRFDRLPDGEKLAKEDMAQLLSLPTESKYKGSLESVGKAIRKHAQNTYLDLLAFFERIVFSFIIGNGDMHLKNWSLLTKNRETRMAPCYDFVSSALYLPKEEESALTMNGKRNHLNRQDFITLAETLKIDPKAAKDAMDRLIGNESTMRRMVTSGKLSSERARRLQEIIQHRCRRLI